MDMDEEGAMENEVEMEDEEMQEEEEKPQARKVYLPGQPIQSDEQLECDETAYVVLHQAKTGCASLGYRCIPHFKVSTYFQALRA